jgi:hypothetical protein
MTKARQDATIKKIERGVEKLIPKKEVAEILVEGYNDDMGENIQDLESEAESTAEGEWQDQGSQSIEAAF